jgi:hypothetical protein
MAHYNWFGRGFSLQLAISAVCTVAFILFGKFFHRSGFVIINLEQDTIKVFSLELLEMKTS